MMTVFSSLRQRLDFFAFRPSPERELRRIKSVRRQIAARFLRGAGIEIGALHQPLELPMGAAVCYVDKMTTEELRSHYPELAGLPISAVDVVDDGEKLSKFDDSSLDFVVANHLIEHCPDPLYALKNWLRVLKTGGVVMMAAPDKRYTFDRDRALTSLDHIVFDYLHGPIWSRETHYEEWVRHVMKSPDPIAADHIEHLKSIDHAIHFHVWTMTTFCEMLEHARREFAFPFSIEQVRPGTMEFIVVLRKSH
jgi:SAM-dependent methyltransferase